MFLFLSHNIVTVQPPEVALRKPVAPSSAFLSFPSWPQWKDRQSDTLASGFFTPGPVFFLSVHKNSCSYPRMSYNLHHLFIPGYSWSSNVPTSLTYYDLRYLFLNDRFSVNSVPLVSDFLLLCNILLPVPQISSVSTQFSLITTLF